VTEMEW